MIVQDPLSWKYSFELTVEESNLRLRAIFFATFLFVFSMCFPYLFIHLRPICAIYWARKLLLNNSNNNNNKMVAKSSHLLLSCFMQHAQKFTWYTVIVLQLPREEAVTLVGSLLCYPNTFPDMPLHQPGHQTSEYQYKSTGKDIKVCYRILLKLKRLIIKMSPTIQTLNSVGLKLFAVCPDLHSTDLLARAQLIRSRLVVVFNSSYVELISNCLSDSVFFL